MLLLSRAGASFILMLTLSLSALAQAPRQLTMGPANMPARTLGGFCYGLDTGDNLPCNPAFIVRDTDTHFYANLYAANNVSYLREVKTLFDYEGNPDTVKNIFYQTRDSQMELNFEAAYRRPKFGISVIPYQVKYYSFVRNRALPQVNLLVSQEESMRLQFGGNLESEGSWGVEVRGVHRKFISSSFSLTDTLAEGFNDSLKPAEQRVIYIEPGLVREWKEYAWSPQMTLALTQLGLADNKYPDFRSSPEFHIGASVKPPVSLGIWQLGFDLAFHNELHKWYDPIRIGSTYDLGMTRLSMSFSGSDYALGFMLRYGAATAGLMYESRWIENWLQQEEWVRTLSLQIGVQL